MALSSKEYWAQREAEQLKHNITEEAAYSKEIDRIYADMLDSVQTQIDSFYGKYADKEGITLAEAKKRVKNLDIEAYERKAKKYVATKDFSPKANEEMRLYNATMKINRLELLKAQIGLETIAGHDELEKYMESILQGRTMDELQRQAGILGEALGNNAKTASAIVNGSFHTGTFSDRIWQYQDMMREDLGRLLTTGMIQGKNPRALAKDLKKYWYGNDPRTGGGARYCMERLMRTELARVQTEAQKQSFERNGYDEYIFIVNGGCCPLCEAAAKKDSGRGAGVYYVKDMMPGTNAPPMHPNCRCSTAAHMNRAEYEAWLDSVANGKAEKVLTNNSKSSILKVNIQQFAQYAKEKFLNYSLNPLKAPDKAKAFKEALGYDLSNYEDLIENLKAHTDESKFVPKGDDGYGMKYEYIVKITGANGKQANVLTAWIEDSAEKRLTSVYVTEKKVTE